MKPSAILLLSSFLFCFCSFQTQAHETAKHLREQQIPVATVQQDEHQAHEHEEAAPEAGNPAAYDHPEKVTADLEDFPNLHPLIVHVPIMMLVLAAVLQLIGFFVFKREISWIVLGIVLFGFLGAYVASNFSHPHVTLDLPEHARKVLDAHDTYAMWTLWLSGIAVLLKAASHFFLKRVMWAEGVVAIVLIASAYTVSMAGHHGAQLVFIEGVGPQGKYLEAEGHSH